jgi:hypothetical protein
MTEENIIDTEDGTTIVLFPPAATLKRNYYRIKKFIVEPVSYIQPTSDKHEEQCFYQYNSKSKRVEIYFCCGINVDLII